MKYHYFVKNPSSTFPPPPHLDTLHENEEVEVAIREWFQMLTARLLQRWEDLNSF